MILADTHTHLYSKQFDHDRNEMVKRAIRAGVNYMLLPNIDHESFDSMWELCHAFPNNCFPMMGIHPCSVTENYAAYLLTVEQELSTGKYIAVGEIGLDFYWEKTFIPQQEDAFVKQCEWAIKYNLPVSIHSRNATYRCIELIKQHQLKNLTGIFHCFSGSAEEAKEIIKLGMYLGIGGVLTYKNSNLPETLSHFSPEYIVFETDAPYLPPVPHRGQRNESAHTRIIAHKMADTFHISLEKMAEISMTNVRKIFTKLPV